MPEGIPHSRAEFCRLWNSPMSLKEIAAHFKCATRTITDRATKYGLPCKTGGAPRKIDRGALVEMFHFGLEYAEIAKALGCSRSAVAVIVLEMVADKRLPPRGKGFHAKRRRDKLTDFLAHKARQRLAEAAKAEQEQLRLAEMVDAPYHGRRAA